MKQNISPLCKVGAIATLLQLLIIIVFSISIAIFGSRPETALEAFTAFQKGALWGLMKDEILLPVMLSFYFISFTALFYLLKDHNFTPVLLSVLFTFTAVTLTIAAHSGFSLMHLSHLYHEAIDPQTKERLLAAGEAVLARNMWNSTASYFAGFLLQGGGVIISLAMIGSDKFGKITIISGVLGNGLDLIQHTIHHAFPAPAEIILKIAGPFYLVWYIMLAVELFKNGKRLDLEQQGA